MKEDLTQETLKKALDYDPLTGIFVWSNNRSVEDFKSYIGYRAYQGKYAGKVAGYRLHDKVSDNFYIQINLKGIRYCGHRLAWLYMYGKWPEHLIDHIDGNGLNNRIDNLREADRLLNARNRRMSKNNKSGVNGVYWEKLVNGWVASGYYYDNDNVRRKKYLGSYQTIEEAENARLNWQKQQEGFTERHGKEKLD
jgi:hypothetical protein